MGGLSAWRRLSSSLSLSKESKKANQDSPSVEVEIPSSQNVLLLHGPRQEYTLTPGHDIPALSNDDEVLVKTRAIGLNPIDWKAPDFNFGIPELPYISGREASGDIVKVSNSPNQFKIGDRVIAIGTDYRDLRKGAFQEYIVAPEYNVVKLPSTISYEEGSTLGVAFVAAVLALGVSMGVDFSQVHGGPDLFSRVRHVDEAKLAEDIRDECLDGINDRERPSSGDWLAIWGGSATSANLAVQLARLVGLKVAVVVDASRHGLRLSNHHVLRPDLLVDSHDPDRAVEILKASTKGQLRFGLDTRGKDTAAHLLRALSPSTVGLERRPGSEALPSPPSTPDEKSTARAHLVGMTGLPKGSAPEGTAFHAIPIKLFHEVPEIGRELSSWLGRLLEVGAIVPPDIIDVEEGLGRVNAGLDRMRKGEIRGGKLVVRV